MRAPLPARPRAATTRRLLAASVVLTLVPALGHAYQFRGVRWTRDQIPVPYEVADSLAPDLGDDAVFAAVRHGMRHWGEVDCTYVSERFSERTHLVAFGVDDGHNVISWRTQRWRESANAIAVTSNISDFQRSIRDSDMIFNDVNFDFSVDGVSRRMDVEAITTHEAGHFFGIGHSTVPQATMFPTTGPGNIEPRSLHEDDIDGICELYPLDILPGEGVGDACSSRGACEQGMLCRGDGEDGYCTRRCAFADDCPEGLFCVLDEGDAPTCVRFEAGEAPGATLGADCGPGKSCIVGLQCMREGDEEYCTGECDLDGSALVRRDCPRGWECLLRRGGAIVCIRADGGDEPDGGGEAADAGDGEDIGDGEQGPDAGGVAADGGDPPLPPAAGGSDGWCSAAPGAAGPGLFMRLRRR